MSTRIALRSDQGPRNRNEDQGIAVQADISGRPITLLGVCDGIGGVAYGLEAARVTATGLLWCLYHIDLRVQSDAGTLADHDDVRSIVAEWKQFATQQLFRASQTARSTNPKDLATTVVAAAMLDQTLIVWWLGDSRAYRFRGGRLEQLTTDHSVLAEQALPEEQALEDPNRNKITKFLRPGSEWVPEILVTDWNERDVVLLMSDGVSGSLASWELEGFLAYWLTSDIGPDDLSQQLLEFIKPNQTDNATVAVAIHGVPKPLGDGAPTVSLDSLLRFGLSADLLAAMTTPPANSRAWRERESPPWRGLRANGGPILNQHPGWERSSEPRKICPKCGRWITDESGCADHPDIAPYQGPYLEVRSNTEFISRKPLRGAVAIGSQSVDTQASLLAGDVVVSPHHLTIEVSGSDNVQVVDQQTDAGVWLKVRHVQFPPEWLQEGMELRVGNHLFVVGTTEGATWSQVQQAPRLIERIAMSVVPDQELAGNELESEPGTAAPEEPTSSDAATKDESGGPASEENGER